MREKRRNTEFFWSVFSRIRTEYGEMRSIWTRKNSVLGHFSRSESYEATSNYLSLPLLAFPNASDLTLTQRLEYLC